MISAVFHYEKIVNTSLQPLLLHILLGQTENIY